MGSLPSAINTCCCARITELPFWAVVLGMAQYIPASANTVSTTSTALFMGETPARVSACARQYMPNSAQWRAVDKLFRREPKYSVDAQLFRKRLPSTVDERSGLPIHGDFIRPSTG